MQQCTRILGLILLAGSLASATPPANKSPEKLQPEEFNTVALIYNDELEILGERAFYPICISMPSGNSINSLLRYLHRYGFAIYESHICNPSRKNGDFPHGMEIEILKLQHGQEGQLEMEVVVVDSTIHVGEHVATALRQGTYQLTRNEDGEWEITAYTKKFDYKDLKERGCESGDASKSTIP